MSADHGLAPEMRRRWSQGLQFDQAVATAGGATLVRWFHRLPELPPAELPAHAVVFVRSPVRSSRVRGRRVDISPPVRRNVGIVAAGDCGRWQFPDASVHACEVTHLYLSPDYLGRLGEREGGAEIAVRDDLQVRDPPLRALMQEIDAALDQPAPDRLYVDCLAAAVGARLIGLQRETALPRGGLAPWQVKRACEAMAARLDAPVTLADLAQIVGLSEAHFSRAFKVATGRAPFAWLAERRIERAQALLETTDASLAEIAQDVGFAAQPQFTTAFRRLTGVTPGRWRRDRRT